VLTVRLYAERRAGARPIETRLTRDPGEGKINSIELGLLGGDLTDEQRQRLADRSRRPIHRTLTA
jgi:hypothetical protein